jgi:hypothetical protein
MENMTPNTAVPVRRLNAVSAFIALTCKKLSK